MWCFTYCPLVKRLFFIQKEAKDILVARRIQAKRDKARSRKQRLQGDEEYKEGSREEKLMKTAQKRVSFS
jgi:hypothetical protein